MKQLLTTYNQLAGQKVQRIEAISDGVFAIALTLLVLDLKEPVTEIVKTERDLVNLFVGLLPKLLTYFLSFMTLGIFWTGHSTQFSFITKSDRHLNWISLFYLLFVSLTPFTTSFLGGHIHFKFAIGLYWLNIFALGAMLLVHWVYANRNDFISTDIADKPTVYKVMRDRIIIAQTLYAAGALLCFINTYLSIGVIIAIQLNYALALFSKVGRKKINSPSSS